MSVSTTHKVWTNSGAKGVHKLVLLALADSAGRNDVSELSLRDIGALCGLSKTRVSEIMRTLRQSGEVRVMSAGAGRGNPTKYKIVVNETAPELPGGTLEDENPDASASEEAVAIKAEVENLFQPGKAEAAPQAPQEITGTDKPKEITQDDVSAVLSAAQVSAPEEKPFFWYRREHRDDLQTYLFKTGKSLDLVCQEVRDAIGKGRGLKRQPVRLTEIFYLIERGRS